MGLKVGIDLGTSYSAIAIVNPDSQKPEIVLNQYGKSTTPSALYFKTDGSILFGEDAKAMQALGDGFYVDLFKRVIGSRHYSKDIFNKNYNALDFSSIFLRKIIEVAEENLKEKIDSAVITCPAYFKNHQRVETIEAGKRAGLNVLSIINEPTAAVLAYGFDKYNGDQKVLIFDLGGGTFDVTIANINHDKIIILGCDGDHNLGGKDWDDCIVRFIADEFLTKTGVDLLETDKSYQNILIQKAEDAKKQLTTRIDCIIPVSFKGFTENVQLTKTTFDSITRFLLQGTKEISEKLLQVLDLEWKAIDKILLVGGSTRMKMVGSFVEEISGKKPVLGLKVDEVVALGAALFANRENKTGLSIGPKRITDVTAHALGMVSINADGSKYVNSVILKKNSVIPCSQTQPFKFKTYASISELDVYVLQGDHEKPTDNDIINKYVIGDIQKTQNRETVIDITYTYDSNAVVSVSAVQTEYDKPLPVKIEPIAEDLSWMDGFPGDKKKPKKMKSLVMVAIDLSYSMSNDPINEAKKAILDFIETIKEDEALIGISVFANSDKILLPPINNYSKIEKAVQSIDVGRFGVGGANEAEPFSRLKKLLSRDLYKEPDLLKFLIVVTDGVWSRQDYAIKQAKSCHEKGFSVIALGFGNADLEFLKKISSTDEYAALTDISGLTSSFQKIAQSIDESCSLKISL